MVYQDSSAEAAVAKHLEEAAVAEHLADDDYPSVVDVDYHTRIDPNPYLLIATLAICIGMNVMLCCMVHWGRKRKSKRMHQEESTHATDQESQCLPEGRGGGEEDVMESTLTNEGIEVVLKRHRPRRRGHAQIRNVMKQLEIVYNEQQDQLEDLSKQEKLRGSDSRFDPSTLGAIESWCDNCVKTLRAVTRCDYDMKRLFQLGLPFVLQAATEGGLETLTVAVIGKLIGTQEVAAYVIVNILVEMTNQIVGGIHESLATLCSYAAANDHRLVGEYVQLSMIFSVAFTLPICVFWYFLMEPTLTWLGFDEVTVSIGKDYAMVFIADSALVGIDETLHALLDTIRLERYSTVMVVSEGVLAFLIVLLVSIFAEPNLQMIGIIHFLVGIFFLLLNIAIISWKNWFVPYLEGMTKVSALRNTKAVKLLLRTALTLSLGSILTEGEWEILTIFASFLGPYAVVAWGILGTLWDMLEMITQAIADAAEVRCAYLLGAGEPERAKMTAYKTILVGLFLAGLISSFVLIAADQIPLWLTNDESLQEIIRSLMPLFALGNIALAMGTMCWTILGAQGRYRLATATAFFGTCIVCVPLAAISTFVLSFNLSGQTACMVLGYAVSGTINAYIIFTSDWEELSLGLVP